MKRQLHILTSAGAIALPLLLGPACENRPDREDRGGTIQGVTDLDLNPEVEISWTESTLSESENAADYLVVKLDRENRPVAVYYKRLTAINPEGNPTGANRFGNPTFVDSDPIFCFERQSETNPIMAPNTVWYGRGLASCGCWTNTDHGYYDSDPLMLNECVEFSGGAPGPGCLADNAPSSCFVTGARHDCGRFMNSTKASPCYLTETVLYQLMLSRLDPATGSWTTVNVNETTSQYSGITDSNRIRYFDFMAQIDLSFTQDNRAIITHIGGNPHDQDPALWMSNANTMVTVELPDGTFASRPVIGHRVSGFFTDSELNADGALGVAVQDCNNCRDFDNGYGNKDVNYIYCPGGPEGSCNYEAVEMLGDSGYATRVFHDSLNRPVLFFFRRDEVNLRAEFRTAIRNSVGGNPYAGFPGVPYATKGNLGYYGAPGGGPQTYEDADTDFWVKATVEKYKSQSIDFSLDLLRDGSTAWLCYVDPDDEQLMVSRWEPDSSISDHQTYLQTGWTKATADVGRGTGRQCQIRAQAESSLPIVSYVDTGKKRIKISYAERVNDTTIWKRAAVTSPNRSAFFPNLYFLNGRPHVMFYDAESGTIKIAATDRLP